VGDAFHFFNQVVEVEGLKLPGFEQRGLLLHPGIEILAVESVFGDITGSSALRGPWSLACLRIARRQGRCKKEGAGSCSFQGIGSLPPFAKGGKGGFACGRRPEIPPAPFTKGGGKSEN
jgi:hypothetical protein